MPSVIPGRIEDANPESIERQECWEKWIPGLRLTANPGMTRKGVDGRDKPGHDGGEPPPPFPGCCAASRSRGVMRC